MKAGGLHAANWSGARFSFLSTSLTSVQNDIWCKRGGGVGGGRVN